MSRRTMQRPAIMTAADYQASARESDWRTTIKDAATRCHWRVLFELPDRAYHLLVEEARRNPSFVSALPPPGWPDLILGKDVDERTSRVLIVELKTDTGKLSPDQVATITTLDNAGLAVRVWRSTDSWDEILEDLQR